MSRNKLDLLFGLILVLVPFSGFPSSWKTVFYIIMGAVLVVVATIAHIRRKSNLNNIYNQ